MITHPLINFRYKAVLLLLISAGLVNLVKAGDITETPAAQTLSSKKQHYLEILPVTTNQITFTIQCTKGTISPTVTSSSDNCNITQVAGGSSTSQQYIAEFYAEAMGQEITITVNTNHVGSNGGSCKDSPFIYKCFLPFVEDVTFGGNANTYIQLESDDTNTQYAAPQWVDNDGDGTVDPPAGGGAMTQATEHNWPVAIVVNTKPQLGAKVKMQTSTDSSSDAYLKASIKIWPQDDNGNKLFPQTTTVQADSTNTYLQPNPVLTTFTNNLTTTDAFYDKNVATGGQNAGLNLHWMMQVGSGTPVDFEETDHTVYVPLNKPATTLTQETLAYLACAAANGKTAIADITTAIWNQFTGRSLEPVNASTQASSLTATQSTDSSKIMTYYGTWALANSPTDTGDTNDSASASGLLDHDDSRCGGWANLLTNVFQFQNLQVQQNQNPVTEEITGLPEPGPGTPIGGGLTIHSVCIGLRTLALAGQNNATPPASTATLGWFSDHALTYFNGVLYDPSYGKSYPTGNLLQAWEDGSLAIVLFQNGDTLTHTAGQAQTTASPTLP